MVTSPETIKFIEELHIRTERAEKVKEAREQFCKEALAVKQKREGGASRARGARHGGKQGGKN